MTIEDTIDKEARNICDAPFASHMIDLDEETSAFIRFVVVSLKRQTADFAQSDILQRILLKGRRDVIFDPV